jgi:transcriptional regulator with XRE-family HTH domain
LPPRRRTSPRSPDHKALGEAFEKLRKNAGLTHEDLAERTGMPFQRISELERGIANPTFATLIRVTEGLGVELSDVATLAEKLRDEKRD